MLLAQPTPEAIASAMAYIIDNPDVAKKMSEFGKEFMKDYPLEEGYEYLFEEYRGELEEINRIDYSSTTHYGNKFDMTREVSAEFLVSTKDNKYDFCIEYTIVKGKKSKDRGISKLVVKSFENEEKPKYKYYEKVGIYWLGWDEGGEGA